MTPPRLVDTHTHLFSKQFDADHAAVMARAQAVCSHVLLPNVDLDSLPRMNALAADYPGFALPMAGLHPTEVPDDATAALDALEAELATGRYVGVGETGLDLYWDKSTLARQQASLRRHIAWARAFDLPLSLHTRNAFAETLALVREGQDGRLRGVFHCFVDGPEQAAQAVDAGFYLGIGGVLTYKNNGGLDATLRAVPRDRIVLETDSPYLPPVPHRGQRNESAHLRLVAERLAAALELTYDEVAALTSANARRLFRLPA